MAVQRFTIIATTPQTLGWSMGVVSPITHSGHAESEVRSTLAPPPRHQGKERHTKASSRGYVFCRSHRLATQGLAVTRPTGDSCVPSSTKGQWSPGLELVAQAVAKKHKRFIFVAKAIVRTRNIQKLASGGDRSLAVHLESLEYD